MKTIIASPLEQLRFDMSLQQYEYRNEDLDTLINRETDECRFQGTQYVMISIPKVGTFPIFSQNMEQNSEKGMLRKNLCDMIGLDTQVITYGKYVMKNGNYQVLNSQYDKKYIGKKNTKDLEILTQRLNRTREFEFRDVFFTKPLKEGFEESGRILRSNVKELEKAKKNQEVIEKGKYEVFCPCCDDYEVKVSIPQLQRFDKKNQISGFSRINYLADGMAQDSNLRQKASQIYQRDVVKPKEELLPYMIREVSQKLSRIEKLEQL